MFGLYSDTVEAEQIGWQLTHNPLEPVDDLLHRET